MGAYRNVIFRSRDCSPTIGRLATYFGLTLTLAGASLIFVAFLYFLSTTRSTVAFALAVSGVPGLIGGRLLFSYGRAMAQPSLLQRVTVDTRPAVLLLRAFLADGTIAERRWLKQASILSPALGRPTFEERLAQVMEDVGPPIALGRPKDILPRVGFSRQYIENDNWQGTLHDLFAKAGWVVFLLTNRTPNLEWEIRTAMRLTSRLRVLVVMPDRAIIETHSTEIRAYVEHHFGVGPDIVRDVTAALIFSGESQPLQIPYPSGDYSSEGQLKAVQRAVIEIGVVDHILDASDTNIVSSNNDLMSFFKLLPVIAVFSTVPFGLVMYLIVNSLVLAATTGAFFGVLLAAGLLIFVLIVTRVRALGLRDRGGWLEREIVLRSGFANLMMTSLAEGGMLHLTNMRLRFTAHRAGAFAADRTYNLGAICDVERGWSAGILPNLLRVRFADGRAASFVVHDRDGWARDLSTVIANLRPRA